MTDEERIIALLIDDLIGMNRGPAATISKRRSFDDVLAHAVAWRRERADGKEVKVGALAWRLLNDRPAPALEDEHLFRDPLTIKIVYNGDQDAAEHAWRRHHYVPAEYVGLVMH